MKNGFLYLLTVLIWGSTWLAIEFQLGEVNAAVSVLYRFIIATIIMWLYCRWANISLKFEGIDHLYILIMALGNFSVNYVLMYMAQEHLTSAMTSIAFSTMLLMNIVNTRLFFGNKIALKTYIGALIGVAGIVILFWDDLQGLNMDSGSALGLALVLTGTLVASLGNMASVRNSNKDMNVFAANAWGMLYGSVALLLYVLVSGFEFGFSTRTSYLASLIYLSVFGTVIAFGSYFALLKSIGPEKASYAIVLFPLVAVILSSLFEGFVWTQNIVLGFVMVLLGNLIVLVPSEKIANRVGKKYRPSKLNGY